MKLITTFFPPERYDISAARLVDAAVGRPEGRRSYYENGSRLRSGSDAASCILRVVNWSSPVLRTGGLLTFPAERPSAGGVRGWARRHVFFPGPGAPRLKHGVGPSLGHECSPCNARRKRDQDWPSIGSRWSQGHSPLLGRLGRLSSFPSILNPAVTACMGQGCLSPADSLPAANSAYGPRPNWSLWAGDVPPALAVDASRTHCLLHDTDMVQGKKKTLSGARESGTINVGRESPPPMGSFPQSLGPPKCPAQGRRQSRDQAPEGLHHREQAHSDADLHLDADLRILTAERL